MTCRAAQLLQLLGRVGCFTVDVHMCAEFLCERAIFSSASDCRDLIAELVGELHSQVTESANALHRDQIAGESAAVPQRVVGGDSSAEQWSRFGILQAIGHRSQCFNRRDHVLLISAVIADAGDHHILTIGKVAAPALDTGIVLTAMPADSDTLPFLPRRNTRTQFIDDADYLMSGNAWILNSRPSAFFGEHVTVANTTSLDFDPHLTWTGFRNFALDDAEVCASFRDLRYLHRCYCDCCRHKSLLRHSLLSNHCCAW